MQTLLLSALMSPNYWVLLSIGTVLVYSRYYYSLSNHSPTSNSNQQSPRERFHLTDYFFRLGALFDPLLLLDLWFVRYLLRFSCEDRMERWRPTKGTKPQQGCQRLYESRHHLRNRSHRDLRASSISACCNASAR